MAKTPSALLYPACLTPQSWDETCTRPGGQAANRGSVIVSRDLNQDGRADLFRPFIANIDSPRGLVWDGEWLYVLHPPDLSAWRDTDGDGLADERRVLVKGIGFGLGFLGADHTSNGIQMGIDGWIYPAISTPPSAIMDSGVPRAPTDAPSSCAAAASFACAPTDPASSWSPADNATSTTSPSARRTDAAAAVFALQQSNDRVLSHTARKAFVALGQPAPALQALASADAGAFDAAQMALREMHRGEVIGGLEKALAQNPAPDRRLSLATTLVRLYFQEDTWRSPWWGTRPDTTGPYYDRGAWAQSPRIEILLTRELAHATPELKSDLLRQMVRHRVEFKEFLPHLVGRALEDPALLETAVHALARQPAVPNVAGVLLESILADESLSPATRARARDALDTSLDRRGGAARAYGHLSRWPLELPNELHEARRRFVTSKDRFADIDSYLQLAERSKTLFEPQAGNACHTVDTKEPPCGPYLGDIAKRYNREELAMSILRPSATIAQGFESQWFLMKDERELQGFVVSESGEDVRIRDVACNELALAKGEMEKREKRDVSIMPEGLIDPLTPRDLASLLAYLEKLASP